MLSKSAIKQAIDRGLLKIEPFDEAQLQSAHIDLHLDGQTISVAPSQFALAKTSEKVTLSSELSGLIDGKAGLAKQGVSIHQSSSYCEPTTNNQITLEIFNASNKMITLAGGQPIAKLLVFRLIDTL
jgi:deoxycytidine triphosphate deaminase